MKPSHSVADLQALIKDVPDFPKKGIVFKDITPLLADPTAFNALIDRLAEPHMGSGLKKVAGIESRGFILASAVALRLGAGVVLVRKKGKLPRTTVSETYALEYGTDTVEIHADAVAKGEKVLLVDDVLATGGTASATHRLFKKVGANVVGASFLIELDFLRGREKITGVAIHSLIHY